jgi:hypothetical protein
MKDKSKKDKNPLKSLWNIISVPMSVLGLLSLSDSIVSFHSNIQHIIDSYQLLVYPVFKILFGCLWFEIPTWIFDYMILGILFTSCQRKVFGLVDNSKILWRLVLYNTIGIAWSIMIWPYFLLGSIYQICRTDSDGIITSLAKDPDPIFIKYNFRNKDILVIRYIGVAIILLMLIVIFNYTYLMRT